MMKLRSHVLLAAMVLLFGCSDGNPATDGGAVQRDAGPAPYGGACQGNEDCAGKLCIDGFCSKLCRQLSDCPPVRVAPDPSKPAGTAGGPCKEGQCNSGLTCLSGECVKGFDCGRVDENTIGCYPRNYDARPFTSAHDCSHDGRCATAYRCIGQPGASDRYCAGKCTSDRQCPPEYRCAEIQTRSGQPEQRCMRRHFGHPCDIDDQCGGPDESELACINDVKGNHYCSKSCTKTDPGTCPPFTRCEDAGNGRLQCKFKAGYAYTTDGEQCAPCIVHGADSGETIVETGGCAKAGYCFLLSTYSGESACLMPCDAEGKCPGTEQACFTAASLGAKLCGPTKTVDGQTILGSCYP